MEALNSSVKGKVAYVKNDVIFSVKNYNDGDSCAVKMTEDNVPFITVDGKKLYFENYIKVGDTYSNGKFKKVIHSSEKESEKTFQVYYKGLCEEEIAKSIINQYYRDYEDFSKNLGFLGVPSYMFKQSEVKAQMEDEEVELIDFTKAYYDKVKQNEVEKLALQAAKDKAKKYGYKVLNDDLTVEKEQ